MGIRGCLRRWKLREEYLLLCMSVIDHRRAKLQWMNHPDFNEEEMDKDFEESLYENYSSVIEAYNINVPELIKQCSLEKLKAEKGCLGYYPSGWEWYKSGLKKELIDYVNRK